LAHERNADRLLERIHNENLSGLIDITQTSATKLRNSLIVGITANRIAAAYGARSVIATARIRAGIKGTFLHPVATLPPALSPFFNNPTNYDGFRFDTNGFRNEIGEFIKCGHDDWTGKLYRLNGLSDAPALSFSARIRRFLDTTVSSGLPSEEVSALKSVGRCLVLGGLRHRAEFTPPRRNREEFYYLAAFYFVPVAEEVVAPETELGMLISQMFHALEISDEEDKKDFERDGLALVAELIPALTNPKTAPSDAVSYFLKRMGDIVSKHMLGFDARHTWVRFVAIDTVFERGNKLRPQFHVFPHHATAQSTRTAIGSFLISHPRRPATVKLILRQWARANRIHLTAETENIFSDLMVRMAEYDVEIGGVCVSEDDNREEWARLNLDIIEASDLRTRCTLGFVVETEVGGRKVPYAIIAFESDIPDAFSKQDARRFRGLINACADLLLGLRLSSSGFDIKAKIRRPFSDSSTLPAIDGGKEFGQYCFELMRIDKVLLDAVINSDEPRIWQAAELAPGQSVDLTREEALKYIYEPLNVKGLEMPGDLDDVAQDKGGEWIRFDKILRRRQLWIRANEQRLYEIWEDSKVATKIYDFLTNIPSNIVWHCYLSAIPRAIAERTIPANDDDELRSVFPAVGDAASQNVNPTFQVMQHGGRSALAMFVFSTATNQFRQIIKLSDHERIGMEADNYRKYVRYQVPLSARMPMSGKAYEGDGNTLESTRKIGDMDVSGRSFGALMSDLIAEADSRARPVTFLRRVVTIIEESAPPAGGKKKNKGELRAMIASFEAAIHYQFENNTRRWRELAPNTNWYGENTVMAAVRAVTRITSDGEDKLRTLTSWFDGDSVPQTLFRSLAEHLTSAPFSALSEQLGQVERRPLDVDMIDAPKLGSIIHGDLNARNLVWSQDYVKFFMIDYERVGLGFYGADQLRLAFALLSDLTVEAYEADNLLPTAREARVQQQVNWFDTLLADLNAGITHLVKIVRRVEEASDLSNFKFDPMPEPTVTGAAIAAILNEKMFSKGSRNFWLFAITMTAAKQLEYAVRDVDDSCVDAMRYIMANIDRLKPDQNPFNLSRYYEINALRDPKHNKYVFAQISRALFAYKVLSCVLGFDIANE
jgi:hypothetical protein